MAEYITKAEALRAVDDAVELFRSEYDEVAEKINNIPAADVVSKEVIRRVICGICNELHSEEPCEPADCAWMERLDNSIREVCDGNNE